MHNAILKIHYSISSTDYQAPYDVNGVVYCNFTCITYIILSIQQYIGVVFLIRLTASFMLEILML